MKALEVHVEEQCIRLYIRRWLQAGVEGESERGAKRKGTPQGGVVSPILANLFLHYTIDRWFEIKYPKLEMVRYSDDSIFHCRTKREAEKLKQSLQGRLEQCGLEMNVDKTKLSTARIIEEKEIISKRALISWVLVSIQRQRRVEVYFCPMMQE